MATPLVVSAVVLRDAAGRVLTVRKTGTSRLMLPGGKLEPGESPAAAAIRESREEIGAELDEGLLRPLGVFDAAAANEPGRTVTATVFEHPLVPIGAPAAEIEEATWVELDDPRLAPLLAEAIFPVLRGRGPFRLAIFTGSAAGDSPAFADAAARLARALGDADVGVVYGGGRVGLMGVVADTTLAAGGTVVGVIPQGLVDRELAHRDLTRLEVVPDMHARKLRMAELADGFVALPGGAGTLEELFEVWTWQQLGIHGKPVALYDVDGYWQPLLHALDTMTARGFLSQRFRDGLIVVDNPADLLDAVRSWTPQPSKWQGDPARG
ncbi:TIGR00730 family Rossman fold protein [Nakamurella flava]|uniref:TIGR00730 family Rossman fold protein n=1 Tax=Nakamurella flava TaxID=2576308 RepID=UPI00197CA914|nr:TIGR00730 family Rossman fold protein [Nakamurella flava]